MNLTNDQKDLIYDILRENKDKFIYGKNKDLKIMKVLDDNNITLELEEITLDNVFKYLTEHWDNKCENIRCNNPKKRFGIFPRRGKFSNSKGYGSYKFCGKECNYADISKRQMGDNNTSHRMDEETFKKMCKTNSEKMKENIRTGKFIPNITNSWSNSMCEINFERDGNIISQKTRSTWEAYFQIFNPNLIYEKMIIPYKFKKEKHNYIVDFVDYENKILYEIKPNSLIKDERNMTKSRYARKWCKLNGYKYIIIKNSWFKKNYDINLVIGQPCENKLIRNLKQFI